jgi:hypothetical protein
VFNIDRTAAILLTERIGTQTRGAMEGALDRSPPGHTPVCRPRINPGRQFA